jgi:hypothetical protein
MLNVQRSMFTRLWRGSTFIKFADNFLIKFYLPIFVPAAIVQFCESILLLYRKIRFGYTFRRIKLTQGKYALVEVEDFEELNKYKWYAKKSRSNCYACRSLKLPDGRRKSISMHRQIINPPDGFLVDHKNRVSLDNRRSNLRPATPAQNSYNRGKSRRKSTSKYKGVSLLKRTGKWRSAIGFEGRTILLGSFTNEKQAALSYDLAAKKYHREFAYLNFIENNLSAIAGSFVALRSRTAKAEPHTNILARLNPIPYTLNHALDFCLSFFVFLIYPIVRINKRKQTLKRSF